MPCKGAQWMVRQRDPIERAMESALQPGRFIAWNQESALVSGLEEVERGVAVLTDSDPVTGFSPWRPASVSPAPPLSLGIDIKVAQELLRHASCRTTLDVYTRAVSE